MPKYLICILQISNIHNFIIKYVKIEVIKLNMYKYFDINFFLFRPI